MVRKKLALKFETQNRNYRINGKHRNKHFASVANSFLEKNPDAQNHKFERSDDREMFFEQWQQT